jgi:hypothetical protein
MATIDSVAVLKKNRHRGVTEGQAQSISGRVRIGTGATSAAASVATSDLLRMIPLGENVRPLRVIVHALPIAGTPVLTNPTFSVGVVPITTASGLTTLTRPDGTQFPALTTSATALVSSVVLDSDNMNQSIEIKRPVADSVSNYGPYYVTLTPAGAGAFSVAGGDIDLYVTVEFIGERKDGGLVYTTYVNQNVNNQT